MGDLDVLIVGRAELPTQGALVAAAHRRSLCIALADSRRLAVAATSAGVTALVDGEDVATRLAADPVILVRSGNRTLPFLRTWLSVVQQGGARIVNSIDACTVSADKLATAVALHAAGVPVVPSYGSLGVEPPAEVGDPFVCKPAFGFHGIGVHLVSRNGVVQERSKTSAWDLVGHEIVQPRVGRGGQDHRVVVIGDRVVAAATRTAPQGLLVTNGDRAAWEPCHDDAITDVAVRAASALGMDYAGVDVISCDDTPHVLEVNGWPGLVLTSAATGVDLAEAVIDHLVHLRHQR